MQVLQVRFRKKSTKKEDRAAQKEKEREEFAEKHKLGSHHRELNPFFKNGGSGMPPTEEEMLEKHPETSRKPEKRKPEITYEDEMEAMWAERTEEESSSRPKKRSKHDGKCKTIQEFLSELNQF